MKIAAFVVGMTLSFSAYAGIAFLKGEYTTGMTKQCIYDYLGSTITRTIPSYQICSYSITV
jgi:predicted ABC-type sugar transport system permease subunit